MLRRPSVILYFNMFGDFGFEKSHVADVVLPECF